MKTVRGASALGTFVMVIALLVALGIVWVYTGGPSRTISQPGLFLSSPPIPSINFSNYEFSSGSSSSTGQEGAGTEPVDTDDETTAPSLWDYFFYYGGGLNVGDAEKSPYAGMVTLSISGAQQSAPINEYITLKTAAKLEKSLTITGWSLQSSATNVTATIGSAAMIPFLGQVNVDTPIVIGPKSTVYIVTGRPPNGTSFRVNKCTGYFEQFQTFKPALKKECPLGEDEMLRYPERLAGNEACITYVERIAVCEYKVHDIPGNIGDACQDFILNDLSYNGCITAHKNDPDFYRNEWRLYLKRDQELYKNTHDNIRLLDENKKFIAEIRY